MDNKLPLAILLVVSQIGYAQHGNTQLSLSSGIANTSGKEKDNFMGNGQNLQADVYLPLYKRGQVFSLGINVGANYTRIKNDMPGNSDVASKYKVYNNDMTIDSRADKSMSNSFSGLLGIQAQLSFGKMLISPGISSGYLSFKQEGFTQTGSISVNGQEQQKDLVKKDREETTGFLLKPQLRIGYNITNNISLFANTAIVRGPEINTTVHYLLPKGGFQENNTYEPAQLASGTWKQSVMTARYNITEFNIGLSMALGKRKKSQQPIKGTGAASASYAAGKMISTEGDGTGTTGTNADPAAGSARPGNPIGGIIVKGGKNPGGNSINLVSNEKGEITLTDLEAGTYQLQLSMPEQPAGKSISEKGLKRNEGAELARPGNPIGGIIVKGGKNPGGNNIHVISNSNGEVLLKNLEAGSYRFVLQTPANDPNAPTEPKKKNKSRKKERATQGVKNVMQTQV